MKVTFCHFDDDDDVSGVSTWLRRLLPSLKDAGCNVSVDLLSFSEGIGSNERFFRDQQIPVRSVPRPVAMEDSVRRCLSWLAEGLPDCYVPNCILGAYFAARWAREAGVPSIGVLHSDDPFHAGIVDEFVAGDALWRVSELVVVSKELADQVQPRADQAGVRVRRIGYGAPVGAVGANDPTSCEVFRLAYVGRLVDEQKQISEVARALCAAAQRFERVEGWIVGDGHAREKVAGLVAESKVGARVRLIGRVEPQQIPEVLAQCHSFVLLSDYEGLPVSLLEAMAAGVVPICLQCKSGIGEVITHDENGLIVHDREEGFLAAVERLLVEPGLWARLSSKARATIQRSFTHEHMVSQWLELIEDVTRNRPTPAPIKPPRRFQLPPSNPKFGGHDMRPTLVESMISNSRIWLGARRQQCLGRLVGRVATP